MLESSYKWKIRGFGIFVAGVVVVRLKGRKEGKKGKVDFCPESVK